VAGRRKYSDKEPSGSI